MYELLSLAVGRTFWAIVAGAPNAPTSGPPATTAPATAPRRMTRPLPRRRLAPAEQRADYFSSPASSQFSGGSFSATTPIINAAAGSAHHHHSHAFSPSPVNINPDKMPSRNVIVASVSNGDDLSPDGHVPLPRRQPQHHEGDHPLIADAEERLPRRAPRQQVPQRRREQRDRQQQERHRHQVQRPPLTPSPSTPSRRRTA